MSNFLSFLSGSVKGLNEMADAESSIRQKDAMYRNQLMTNYIVDFQKQKAQVSRLEAQADADIDAITRNTTGGNRDKAILIYNNSRDANGNIDWEKVSKLQEADRMGRIRPTQQQAEQPTVGQPNLGGTGQPAMADGSTVASGGPRDANVPPQQLPGPQPLNPMLQGMRPREVNRLERRMGFERGQLNSQLNQPPVLRTPTTSQSYEILPDYGEKLKGTYGALPVPVTNEQAVAQEKLRSGQADPDTIFKAYSSDKMISDYMTRSGAMSPQEKATWLSRMSPEQRQAVDGVATGHVLQRAMLEIEQTKQQIATSRQQLANYVNADKRAAELHPLQRAQAAQALQGKFFSKAGNMDFDEALKSEPEDVRQYLEPLRPAWPQAKFDADFNKLQDILKNGKNITNPEDVVKTLKGMGVQDNSPVLDMARSAKLGEDLVKDPVQMQIIRRLMADENLSFEGAMMLQKQRPEKTLQQIILEIEQKNATSPDPVDEVTLSQNIERVKSAYEDLMNNTLSENFRKRYGHNPNINQEEWANKSKAIDPSVVQGHVEMIKDLTRQLAEASDPQVKKTIGETIAGMMNTLRATNPVVFSAVNNMLNDPATFVQSTGQTPREYQMPTERRDVLGQMQDRPIPATSYPRPVGPQPARPGQTGVNALGVPTFGPRAGESLIRRPE